MPHNYTHVGVVIGSIFDPNKRTKVYLRELKLHWATAAGSKFSKRNGYPINEPYPRWHLDLESIQQLDSSVRK